MVDVRWTDSVIPLRVVPSFDEPLLEEHGLYQIFVARKDKDGSWSVIRRAYIGKAFGKTLRDEIIAEYQTDSCIQRLLNENRPSEAVVMLGIITSESSITRQLLVDTECCLIYRNQPDCNEVCKESYHGRDIVVRNLGIHHQLIPESRCGAVFR